LGVRSYLCVELIEVHGNRRVCGLVDGNWVCQNVFLGDLVILTYRQSAGGAISVDTVGCY